MKVKQLDFLLSKATEYSNFIAADLEELQNSMSESARQESSDNNNTKIKLNRKRKSKSSSNRASKKSNDTTNGETNLLHAQQKHKQTKLSVGSSRPIFIQPKNLASNCNLKYYQLEGVR